MHWWSLKVIISRTHQSPILEARRGAAIVRSIIDPPAPRLNVRSLPRFNTISSFLAIISLTKIPLLSRRASPHSGDLLLKSPAIRDCPLASLNMGDIFFAPISASQAPRGSLALLEHVRRTPTPPAGILPAWKGASAGHMAISLQSEVPGNLDMLSDAAVHPRHP